MSHGNYKDYKPEFVKNAFFLKRKKKIEQAVADFKRRLGSEDIEMRMLGSIMVHADKTVSLLSIDYEFTGNASQIHTFNVYENVTGGALLYVEGTEKFSLSKVKSCRALIKEKLGVTVSDMIAFASKTGTLPTFSDPQHFCSDKEDGFSPVWESLSKEDEKELFEKDLIAEEHISNAFWGADYQIQIRDKTQADGDYFCQITKRDMKTYYFLIECRDEDAKFFIGRM